MYTAAAIVALALSLSAPTLAVPVSGSHPKHHGHHGRVQHQQAHPAHRHHHGTAHHPTRELDLLTRELPFEARNPFIPPPINHIPILPPLNLNDNTFSQHKREMIEDLFIRELLAARDDDASGASIFSSLLSAIPKVVGGLFSGGGNSQQQQKQRRDLEDLLIREFVLAARDADESGASIFSEIFSAIPKVVGSLFGGGSSSQPQPQPQPQPTSQPLPQQQRRELEDLFVRELVLAARDADESGASIFSSLLGAVPKLVGGLLGGGNSQQQQKQRRDLEDLLVREFVLAARDADESGASIISTIIGAIPKVISGLSSLFGGGSSSQPQQQPQPVPTSQPLPQATTQAKREMIEDLIMRELFTPAARSLYELD